MVAGTPSSGSPRILKSRVTVWRRGICSATTTSRARVSRQPGQQQPPGRSGIPHPPQVGSRLHRDRS